jgi:hypothetical protein
MVEVRERARKACAARRAPAGSPGDNRLAGTVNARVSARRESPDPGSPGESPLGRALTLLLPALVHRLNNALTSIQLVLELDAPGARERSIALEDARTMRALLGQLGALVAQRPGARELDLAAAVRSLCAFLAPMAERAGVTLEARVPPSAFPARVPARFEALLTALLAELLAARAPGASRVRVSVRTRAQRGLVLVTTDASGASPPMTLDGVRQRRSGGARSFVVEVDLLSPAEPARCIERSTGERSTGLRVLVLQRDRERRGDVEELLRQRGHRVTGATTVPADEFDVVLVDADLAASSPGLLEVVRADRRLSAARIVAIGRWDRGAEGLASLEATPRPARLLEMVERSAG